MRGEQMSDGLRIRETDCIDDRQTRYHQTPRQGAGAKKLIGVLGKALAILTASAILLLSAGRYGAASDQLYILRSPSFGGNNTAPFQYEQLGKTLRDQRAAAKAAASAPSSTTTDPNQQFANAIISQLNSLVARNIALKIADSHPGEAGTIESGNVSITFVNSDGQLNVVITTPAGTTNLSVPTGD